MRKAFTLMEINLAILVMAGGILSICGLFSLGYRESRQSTEDVEAAAYADAVISPIVMAVSAPTLKWSNLQNLSSKPSDQGWRDYLDTDGTVKSNPEATARAAFSSVLGALGVSDVKSTWPENAKGELKAAGLVVTHEQGSGVVKISFRACKNPAMLMSAPIFYAEARYEGYDESVDNGGGGN